MKSASSAAARTDTWSPARQNFAYRVTTTGSFAQKVTTETPAKGQMSQQVEQKKKN